MVHHTQKASAKSGMLPGTIVYVGENEPKPTVVFVHIYDADSYHIYEELNIQQINQAIKAKQHVWIDIIGLADISKISEWCYAYNIHPLIIEDILNTRQRSKLDMMHDGLFIVLKLLYTHAQQLTYGREQFCMVLKKHLLITFRESDNYDLSPMIERLKTNNSPVREQDIEYLAYLILDNIVDDYFNFVELTEDSLSEIEDKLIVDPATISLKDLYTISRRTMTLHKVIAPLRDVVHLLLSEHGRLINPHYLLHYRDLHDHSIRLVELIDLHREMSTGMLNIYLSAINNRMNETMKVLTLFASIFIPLTFIAGVYGMNFKVMPELNWRYAYPAVMTSMVVLAGIMFYFFKRKKLI